MAGGKEKVKIDLFFPQNTTLKFMYSPEGGFESFSLDFPQLSPRSLMVPWIYNGINASVKEMHFIGMGSRNLSK